MIDLRVGRQTFEYDCGAKALQIVMAYYGVDIREDELIKELGTDNKKGTSYKKMIAFAEKSGFQVVTKCGTPLKTVQKYVDENNPVIVLVQAWAEQYMTLKDWRESNNLGHYVVVIGYNDSIIVFEDPSSIRRTWLTRREFMARWHDTDPRTQDKLNRFSMVLLGKQPLKKTMEHMD